ncbi:MAG TPA: tRNA pseudouridine(38-40) synthase TruA [Gemmatimonas sp.]|nr:tRNA pseudouridine(38-40) synthase TruA [Gemmatimonas sp.]
MTQYDGGQFAGWQRQPDMRTVQGEMERVLERLCGEAVVATGAGRTDAGVHAHGQGVGVRVSAPWEPASIRKAMNALLPDDIWVAEAHRMRPEFHPRFSATGRRYRYLVGSDDASRSPFRRPYEWPLGRALDGAALRDEAGALLGEHTFRAFAVARTAPVGDDHRCVIHRAEWKERDGGWVFEVEANRFLHHMVRFLVGTMVEVAQGRRPRGSVARLLTLPHNAETSAKAPACGLSLCAVTYPLTLYERAPVAFDPTMVALSDSTVIAL